MNVQAIVTGGAGFIGSNLVRRLVNDGHDVSIFDNLATGNKTNITSLIPMNRLFQSYRFLSQIESPDIIFHLGIPSSSPMYKQNPFLVSEALGDWITILEYAVKVSCKIIYASSSSIYNGHEPPFHEALPVYVTDYYTECRYSMERLAELYYRLHNVPAIGLRLFSVYGPNETYKQQYANCLTQFLWAMQRGESPVIFGDGSQTRDLTHVSDVVTAFYTAATSSIQHDIFNVGTGKAYSFNEIVALLNHALGTDITPTYIDNPIKNYVGHTRADTRRAAEKLRFKASINLPEGINNILAVY
ncbi:MAG: NAD-dependent epimerase/dehydratase family protein [Candidatus Bathyarchaeota archaeon]|jgi:UDP-glucose 4-epimerase|nr:NAD-dependent epimerase/dehydratase family protein [Candidatus Bathyarchaeota archaeon]